MHLELTHCCRCAMEMSSDTASAVPFSLIHRCFSSSPTYWLEVDRLFPFVQYDLTSDLPGLAEDGSPQWVDYSACDKTQRQGNANSLNPPPSKSQKSCLICGVSGESVGAGRCWPLWLRDADFQLKTTQMEELPILSWILETILPMYCNALAMFIGTKEYCARYI